MRNGAGEAGGAAIAAIGTVQQSGLHAFGYSVLQLTLEAMYFLHVLPTVRFIKTLCSLSTQCTECSARRAQEIAITALYSN